MPITAIETVAPAPMLNVPPFTVTVPRFAVVPTTDTLPPALIDTPAIEDAPFTETDPVTRRLGKLPRTVFPDPVTLTRLSPAVTVPLNASMLPDTVRS